MKKKMLRKLCLLTAAGALVIGTFAFLQALLMPKYGGESREGNLIAEYYRETREHDVLFVGDCEVYENFSPVKLWQDYGITSYIPGSAQQLVWQSYYLLEEMLAKETPRAVVFNVLALRYGTPQSEAYNRMTLDGMKLSSSKIKAVKASLTEGESLISYLLPLLRFHSRWSELTGEDVRQLFQRDPVGQSGYLLRTEIKPLGALPTKRPLADYEFSGTAWEYLDRMRSLCESKGVQLILIKAPVTYPYWYEEWDRQVEGYAETYGLSFINLLDYMDELGLDWSVDTYDGGLHLNVTGAEKATHFLGEKLAELIGPVDHSGDKELYLVWEEKIAAYRAEWQRQLQAAGES